MKKTSAQQPNSNKAKNKTIVFLAIAGMLFIAGILGYVGYNKYLDYQDKQRFETVRASVETLRGEVATSCSSWRRVG